MKTGRLVINHEAPLTGGFAAEIASTIQKKRFLHLESPIERVCGSRYSVPAGTGKEYVPDYLKTYEAIKRSVNF